MQRRSCRQRQRPIDVLTELRRRQPTQLTADYLSPKVIGDVPTVGDKAEAVEIAKR